MSQFASAPVIESHQLVLVVDDSPTEMELVVHPLEQEGFRVLRACDGDEALETVLIYKPHCIILDIVLPKMNGFQVCRTLKRYQGTCHIPVIMLTCKMTSLDRAWGMRQGADAFMTKPFDTHLLIEQVKQLLGNTPTIFESEEKG